MTHTEFSESAAAYALDALDDDDRAAFEAHMSGCPACRADVDEQGRIAGALAFAVEPVAPEDPPALRKHVLGRARGIRPITTPPRRRRAWLIPWAAAAAGIALAAVSATLYFRERAAQDRLEQDLAAARATIVQRDSTLGAFLGPEVHVVSLGRPGAKPVARVFWNHTRNIFIVTASGLPPTPSGSTYQLWAVQEGRAPQSMGTFDTDRNGRAVTVLPVAPSIVDAGFIDACALTIEPAGGSPQPTEPPRLTGTWRHVD